jgi:hypothetical protein
MYNRGLVNPLLLGVLFRVVFGADVLMTVWESSGREPIDVDAGLRKPGWRLVFWAPTSRWELAGLRQEH